MQPQVTKLKTNVPNIVVGAPGRIVQLVESGALKLDKVEYFVLDECDKMLQNTDMRAQVQGAFRRTPHGKQVGDKPGLLPPIPAQPHASLACHGSTCCRS